METLIKQDNLVNTNDLMKHKLQPVPMNAYSGARDTSASNDLEMATLYADTSMVIVAMLCVTMILIKIFGQGRCPKKKVNPL